jgi:dihydroneopterin aldolase
LKVRLSNYIGLFSIGILPHELTTPQRLLFTIEVRCQDPGTVAENLDMSFDYRALLTCLTDLQTGHTDLLETLTERIAHTCFQASPLVLSLTVQVSKLDLLPPTDPACPSPTIGIERTFDRPVF